MEINVQSLSFQASNRLIDFAENKIGKLSQYSQRVMEAHVILKFDKSGTKNNKFCEIRLAIPGNDLFASKQCHALKQQLLRWKNKNQEMSLNQSTPSQGSEKLK